MKFQSTLMKFNESQSTVTTSTHQFPSVMSAASAEAPPPAADAFGDGRVYYLRSQAALLTWQCHFDAAELEEMGGYKYIKEWSWCRERASRDHTHAFIVLDERRDGLPLSLFNYKGSTPNCTPSSSRGRSARRGWDRAHFYVYCPFKTSHLASDGNYRPGRDYAVETSWVVQLWRQGKVDEVVECCASFRCLTPTLEGVVTRTIAKQREVKRKVELDRRARILDAGSKDFRVVAAVEYWREQYNSVLPRYKFLWLSGPSGMGKSMFAKSLAVGTHWHSAGVSWAGYDPVEHEMIIFDDIYDQEDYISKHKPIFQASRTVTVNTSRTNCFAQSVDTAGKKIVVCSNYAPRTTWVNANCIHYAVTEPLWVDQHMLLDV